MMMLRCGGLSGALSSQSVSASKPWDPPRNAKRQIDSGWLTSNLAGMFLGFDLDRSQLDSLAELGVISRRDDGGIERYSLDDILVYTGQTAQQLLSRWFPYSRQKKSTTLQRVSVLNTCQQRDIFRRNWDRLYRVVSLWIANQDEDLSVGELKLAFQLLERARAMNRFELVLTATQLQRSTGLDREGLPKARRGLERRQLLRTERNGTTAWRYWLCDPATGKPVAELPDNDAARLHYAGQMR